MPRPLGSLAAALCLMAGLLAAGPAAADGTAMERLLSAADQERLAAYETVRAETLSVVRATADPEAVATLDLVLDRPTLPIRGTDIRGAYRCRTIKLDAPLPLVIYGWFECRIEEDDIGYRIVKLTGSQRLSGHFITEAEDRLVYYGALHYSREAPIAYGSDPDRDQVGYMFRTGPGSLRLELPLPTYESRLDILQLEPL